MINLFITIFLAIIAPIIGIIIQTLVAYFPLAIYQCSEKNTFLKLFKKNIRKYNLFTLLITIVNVVTGTAIYFFNIEKSIYEMGFYLLFNYSLVALFFIDYKTKLLPDAITIPLIWIGLIYNVYYGNIEHAVLGAIIGYMLLWIVFWLFKLTTNKEGIGYGDFKLLSLIGSWLGYLIIPHILLTASILGILYFLIFVKTSKQPFAFGPMLILAIPLSQIL